MTNVQLRGVMNAGILAHGIRIVGHANSTIQDMDQCLLVLSRVDAVVITMMNCQHVIAFRNK